MAVLILGAAFIELGTITTSSLSTTTYCPGDAVQVPYTVLGTYTPGNIFTAHLSNASGSFISPTSIGTLTATTGGTINATIPANTAAGKDYRIRVVSTNPAVTGSDNGSDIIVTALTTFYFDWDDDGYGDATSTTQACTMPAGYVNNSTDCDDTKGAFHPGATEICDGLDNNCDGIIDEGFASVTYYRDVDVDGYGNLTVTTTARCGVPAGYVTNSSDCNDANAAVKPGAVEVCGNGIDDNCNGQANENCGVCANATALTTTNITSTSAKLNWVASVNPAQWEVQYKPTAPGGKWKDVLLAGSARSAVISGLSTNLAYNWRIRAKCGKNSDT